MGVHSLHAAADGRVRLEEVDRVWSDINEVLQRIGDARGRRVKEHEIDGRRRAAPHLRRQPVKLSRRIVGVRRRQPAHEAEVLR
eukprot:7259228-Prymnesium_polylepis.1